MVNTHIVRCITEKDHYTTFGKEYECWFSDEHGVGSDAEIIDDDGDPYYLFSHEYEIVGVIDAK